MNVRRFFPGTGVVVAFIVVIAVAVTGNIQTNDQIFLPLKAEAINGNVLTIADHPPKPNRGTFYFTFVREEQANLLSKFYYQHFDPDASIMPNQAVYGTSNPSPQQQQQVQQQNVADMIDSKKQAELAALNVMGKPIPAERVAVLAVEPQSKAKGKLQPNDVILAANGHQVHSSQQLINVIQAVQPGDPISLLVQRPKKSTFHLTVPTIRNPSTGKAAIGIIPTITLHSDPNLPYKISFDTGDVAGPSAGLMFALAIVNRLSPTDLTHGYKIAGTGTINADGVVGPIGGVKQKVIGAHEAGAKYFFVPAYCDPNVCNYKEAKPYAKGITLLPVNTIDEALNDLRHLK